MSITVHRNPPGASRFFYGRSRRARCRIVRFGPLFIIIASTE